LGKRDTSGDTLNHESRTAVFYCKNLIQIEREFYTGQRIPQTVMDNIFYEQ
jgi:hypothetical protein